MSEQPVQPLLRVVRGEPTAEELAALVAVLAARQAATAAAVDRARRAPRPAWGDPATAVRRPVTPGPDAWRRSALPG